MKALNNLKLQQKCLNCELRTEGFFCHLPRPVLKTFETLKITNAYPKGATIFIEGQPASGIYMLCQGRVKLSVCSKDGKVIILRIADPGEVLGLSATLSGSAYEVTAKVLEPCQVNFVRKDDFLRFISQNIDASSSVIKQFSHKYRAAYDQIRSLGLSHTAADKLAGLLLDWAHAAANGSNDVHIKNSYTHEEIAEMIGTSRETVTRLLKEFKDRKLITLKGPDLTILDRKKLESAIGGSVRT